MAASGILNNIMSLFHGATAVPGQPPANTNPALSAPSGSNQPGPLASTVATANTDTNGVIPANGQTAPADGKKPEAQSVLEQYKDIFNITKVEGPDPNAPIFANLDSAKIMEQAGKMDFTKQIPKELLSKVAAGGEGAVEALLQVVQSASQHGFGQSAITTAKLVEQALAKQNEKFMAQLPALVRQHAVSDSLQIQNPKMKDPAVAPLVQVMERMVMEKNPQASSAEVATLVNGYFAGLSEVFAPPKTEAAVPKNKQESDFSNFLLGS